SHNNQRSIHTLHFFSTDTYTPQLYTLSLHDALPISGPEQREGRRAHERTSAIALAKAGTDRSHMSSLAVTESRNQPGISNTEPGDRKSTRLNSSHVAISYAVFCLKKKKTANTTALYS